MATTFSVSTTINSPPPLTHLNTRIISTPSLHSSTPSINDSAVLGERRRRRGRNMMTKSEDSPKFKFSKLLSFNNHQQQDQPQLQNQPQNNHSNHHERSQTSPPLSPFSPRQQEEQPSSHHNHHYYQHHRHHPQTKKSSSTKHQSSSPQFRRGSFLGFLQSHYHVFQKQTEQKSSTAAPNLNGHERQERGFTAVSPRSTSSSVFSSSSNNNPTSKSPHATFHSEYNVTVSDTRAHATIASVRSSIVPTKVTDISYGCEGNGRPQDITSTISSGTTLANSLDNVTKSETVSVTPNKCRRSGMASPPCSKGGGIRSSLRSLSLFGKASPNSPGSTCSKSRKSKLNGSPVDSNQPKSNGTRQRRGSFLDRLPSQSPSKHMSKILETGAARIGLIKKRRSFSDHYLSLPLGGAETSANEMYMLQSENLSVTEFAKLAGITILPENDDGELEINEELSFSESNVSTSEGMIGFGSGTLSSYNNTLGSSRSLTSGSVGSSKMKRANIWEPQFWTVPVNSENYGAIKFSSSSASLLLPQSPISVSAPASPLLTPAIQKPNKQDIVNSFECSGDLGYESTIDPLSTFPQKQKNSYTPPSSRANASNTPIKRPDTHQKDTAATQLSKGLSLQRPYTSLTAIAIELETDEKPKEPFEAGTGNANFDSDTQLLRQQPLLTSLHSPQNEIRLEPSEPIGKPIQSLRISYPIALHALQSTRCRQNGNRRQNLKPVSVRGARTRSPSPSPLSRQLEISDSEGFDSPLEEKDEFEFQISDNLKASNTSSFITSDELSIGHTAPEKEANLENSSTCAQFQDNNQDHSEKPINTLYHHKTQSLPMILLNHYQDESEVSSPCTSSTLPEQSQPKSASPCSKSNSTTPRKFTPGTKVGRFTLVQDTCMINNIDIIRAQNQYQHALSQRRSSAGDMKICNSISGNENNAALKNYLDDSRSEKTRAHRRFSTVSDIEGGSLSPSSRVHPAMEPEENVVVFHRKRAKRLQQPLNLLAQPQQS